MYDELRDRLSAWGVAFSAWVASSNPQAVAAAHALAQEEQYMHAAHALGLDPAVIKRMQHVARGVGPKTTLPNHDVWPAVWRAMLEEAKKGTLPLTLAPYDLARLTWRELFYEEAPFTIPLGPNWIAATVEPRALLAFRSLVEAVERTLAEEPDA